MITPSAVPATSIDLQARRKAAVISLLASVVLLAMKATAAGLTGSSAILSDALESIVNVVTAVVALVVIRFVAQPADREHPYGHGKAEFISATFEGGLIVFAAIAIALESIRAMIHGPHLHDMGRGIWLVTGAAVLNLILGLYLRRVGKKALSETLLASSSHILADVKTTVGVVLGLGLVRLTGLAILDPIIALLIAAQLVWEGYGIVRKSFGGLLDELDVATLTQLSKSIRQHRQPGIIDIHQLKAIRSGSFHHIDAHLVVPEFWDVLHAHQVTHDFEHKIVKDYPYDGEIAFHLDPCRMKYCRHCDLDGCPIRKEPLVSVNDFDLKSIIGEAPYV